MAALLGLGAALAWERRRSTAVLLGVALTVAVTTGFAAWLMPSSGTGLPSWLDPVVLAVGLLATVVLVAAALGCAGKWLPDRLAYGLAGAAVLLVPAVASASVVAESLGPFDTPFQPALVTAGTHAIFAPTFASATLAQILKVQRRRALAHGGADVSGGGAVHLRNG